MAFQHGSPFQTTPMITFTTPITVIKDSQVITALPFISIDNEQKQTVHVRFVGIPKLLLVWSGAEYVAAGDYTQAALESAVTNLLGSNPAAFLSTLFDKTPVAATPAPAPASTAHAA